MASAAVTNLLAELRKAIRAAIPKAEEAVSYGMPAFVLNGKKIVWFSAYKNHIGFYPGAAATRHFAKELARYKIGKGSIQFPLDRPLPLALITRLVRYRALEVSKKSDLR